MQDASATHELAGDQYTQDINGDLNSILVSVRGNLENTGRTDHEEWTTLLNEKIATAAKQDTHKSGVNRAQKAYP